MEIIQQYVSPVSTPDIEATRPNTPDDTPPSTPVSEPLPAPLELVRQPAIPTYKRVMIFDTETTGLFTPKKNPISNAAAADSNVHPLATDQTVIEQKPYITQLSMIVYDMNEKKICQVFNSYIKIPSNVPISEESMKITGITRELCETKGIDICKALEVFFQFYKSSDCVVAHNLEFDKRMILTELERNYHHFGGNDQMLNMFNPIFERLNNIDQYCTMRGSSKYCNILTSKDGALRKFPKYPKLNEFYQKLFNEEPTNLHDSLVDTLVCMRCFLKFRMFHHISDSEYQKMKDLLLLEKK
jgi:DNA polymerase-3 subunit alpha